MPSWLKPIIKKALHRELGDIEGANLDRAIAVKLGIK
jgi:hypothetical protein